MVSIPAFDWLESDDWLDEGQDPQRLIIER